MKDKYAIIAFLQWHVDAGLRYARPATAEFYTFERLNSLLEELDKVMQGEQKELLIAQLNASVREKHK